MPLTVDGEDYREFSEPRFFECETVEHVRQIPLPTDKAFAFQGAAVSAALALYKFDSTSVDADDGSTVLKPNNPVFDAAGRWLAVLSGTGGGGSGGAGNFIGTGSPEGIVTADPASRYWQEDGGSSQLGSEWVKLTGAGNTGWFEAYTL